MDDPAQVGLEVGGGERLKVGQGGGGDVPVDDQDHDGDDWDRQQGVELSTELNQESPFPLKLALALLNKVAKLLMILQKCVLDFQKYVLGPKLKSTSIQATKVLGTLSWSAGWDTWEDGDVGKVWSVAMRDVLS